MALRPLRRVAALLLPAFLGAASTGAADEPGYRVVRRLEIGGDGGWDYLAVDSAARRLYVTRSTRVMALDADSGAVVGEIPDTAGVHGVAIAPELGRGFTSNGRSSTISIFDVKTLKPVSEIKSTGENPDAILYDPASRRVFAFNGRSASATAIEAATGQIAGTIALDGRPEFAAADGNGRVYVNLEDKSIVAVIDARKLAVEKRWPLAPCEEPSGMAIDREHKRLFVGCGNRRMAVLDAENGRVVTTVPIGEGVDANGYDPGTGLAFSSNGDGTLTVVREDSPDRYSLAQTVVTQTGARTMALDEKTHNIFLATARFGPPPSPTAERPHPRPSIVPGSFVILVVAK
ncbi:MAG TPA: PQQ-binding-like beta-propeller repeat protein [Thermoanaerobaculia bacterium]|nr:PQQ-binding-like beta-propeller repeat protein [Thermoanaerobaculia bacterium]